ncbi:hypothetical protein PISMIDRAFT_328929 [Pisolithus microcarpus 441]|uniref:Uncharacterized protein n=1 Tax=Pisolithus microcarpus 441 TaxID=765257 RepID=A0A0C9XSH8_9AGAM|nr:hypothetical protein PISMIDRAFT_328929 [Pisolithus microcarpus 441]
MDDGFEALKRGLDIVSIACCSRLAIISSYDPRLGELQLWHFRRARAVALTLMSVCHLPRSLVFTFVRFRHSDG